jgi:hypothetical protein
MRTTIFVAGIGLTFIAVTNGEFFTYGQPSDPACEWRQNYLDFGRPEGCG